MPRPPLSTPAAAERVRGLQSRLSQLSVPVLLRVREAAAAALERETLRARDADAVVRAARDR